MTATGSDLSTRFAAAEIDRLQRRFGRVLEDNPDGEAIFAAALEQGMRLGFDAWCAQAGPPAAEPDAEELWDRWQAQRWLAPEGESWPERLGRAGSHETPDSPEPSAVEAVASPDLGVPPLDGMVRVISTWNRPECEMLQGMLANAGIRSFWNRSGGDARYDSGSGSWDIYVPVDTAEEARVVLSTVRAEPGGD